MYWSISGDRYFAIEAALLAADLFWVNIWHFSLFISHFGLIFYPYILEKRKKFGVDHSWFTLKLCWVILKDFPVLLIAKYQLSNQRGNSEKRWKLSHFHTNIFCYCYMMNLSLVPPLGVKIMTEDQPMVSGREYSLKCVSWGSLPPAEISWYRRQSYGAKVTQQYSSSIFLFGWI